MEEALSRWLEEQGDRMEALKESLDQKRKELTKMGAGDPGSWGQEWVLWQGLNPQRERSQEGVKGRPIERGSIGKRSEGDGIYRITTWPDPKEAAETLVIKYNYPMEGNRFKNTTRWDESLRFRASDKGTDKSSGSRGPEHRSEGTSRNKSSQEPEPGPEQEARPDIGKEHKQSAKAWKPKMETEEGAKEV